MILHREFLPFLPLNSSQPKGPNDTFSPFSARILPDSAQPFWTDSSIELFKSTQDLSNLFKTCNEWKTLPETPLVVFASYIIAMIGVYSAHFPWMDLSQQQQLKEVNTVRGAVELVESFSPRFRMADNWFRTISRFHHLFSRTKKDLRRHHKNSISTANGQQNEQQFPSLRMTDESHIHLDNLLGSDHTRYRDQEMPDATDYKPSTHLDRGQAETVARQTWESISSQNGPEVDGLPNPPEGHLSPGASRSTYPPISPQTASQPYTPNSLPQFPYGSSSYPATSTNTGAAAAANGPEKTTETPAAPPARNSAQPWTQEKFDQWLASLEMVFGGNDVIAFVEGVELTESTAPGSHVKGWLKLIWS